MKKFIALLLSVVLCFSMFASAYATAEGTTGIPAVESGESVYEHILNLLQERLPIFVKTQDFFHLTQDYPNFPDGGILELLCEDLLTPTFLETNILTFSEEELFLTGAYVSGTAYQILGYYAGKDYLRMLNDEQLYLLPCGNWGCAFEKGKYFIAPLVLSKDSYPLSLNALVVVVPKNDFFPGEEFDTLSWIVSDTEIVCSLLGLMLETRTPETQGRYDIINKEGTLPVLNSNLDEWLTNRGYGDLVAKKNALSQEAAEYYASLYIGTATITSKGTVNLRAGGSTKHKVVAKAKQGDTFNVVSKADSGWYELELEDGTTGFISPKLIDFKSN